MLIDYMGKNDVMIGLEIHGYIESEEKLFCRCKNFHDMKKIKPNTNVCPVCTGQPGSKPMLPNKSAIDKIIEIGLILGCKVNVVPRVMVFQRKHYSWPDMPYGYQKTISGGHSDNVAVKGKFEGIGITEVHLEEDPAAWNPESGKVDYNRAGVPLVEIVTDPDFKSSVEVVEWLKKLVLTLSYIRALNKDAGIKADVNVNIKGVSERVEIKNVNSISEIARAIDSEIERHKKEKPKSIETRRWNSDGGITELMRSKENQADYRFISDPDLPALKIDKKRVDKLKKKIPETPMEKLDKIIKKHKIGKKDAEVLTQNLDIAELYEEILEKGVDSKFALPWITVEWFSVLNYNKKSMDDVEINVEHFVELLSLVKDGKITPLKGKEILRKFIPKSFSAGKEALKSGKIDDENELRKVIEKVVRDNEKVVEDYKNGEKKSLNFLMGQIMKETDRRADFVVARKVLERELK
ncbi:Asp-tRNA(Asn)/Glu-tRNA(Gln) amidotransferase GatCAB subunit B [Candidatus Pacearchaeota archaeon]|nr:Asp-tRNA(Asn)/Glu-tRNA(Gln) amidotransferase GatCAB subunit B [Candidatus Pacearchaeota archaeon]